MNIDIHAHCIPPAFLTWLERHARDHGVSLTPTPRGPTVTFDGRVTTAPLRPDLGDLEGRLLAMDRIGIDIQVLAGWIDMTGYEIPAARAGAYARAHNEALASVRDVAPERFEALATVPLQSPDAAIAELEYAMGNLGMKGAQIATRVDGRFLDQVQGLDAVWEAAESLGAFVLLHPMRPLVEIDLGRHFMENMIARPAESTIAIDALILSGVFARHPDLRMCVVHGGGFAPFQAGRLDQGFRQKPDLVGDSIDEAPSSYLRRLYVDTVVHSPAALRFLVEMMGPDHVLLGTDFPFEMGDQDPLALLDAAGLDTRSRALVAGGNAAGLLGIG